MGLRQRDRRLREGLPGDGIGVHACALRAGPSNRNGVGVFVWADKPFTVVAVPLASLHTNVKNTHRTDQIGTAFGVVVVIRAVGLGRAVDREPVTAIGIWIVARSTLSMCSGAAW